MISDKKLVDFVTQLVRLTQEGQVRWHVSSRRTPPDARGAAFEADFDDRILRIYRRTVVETGTDRGSVFFRDVKPVLELIDLGGEPLYQFPYVQGVDDLYQVAAYKGSDAEKVIEEVLSTRSPT